MCIRDRPWCVCVPRLQHRLLELGLSHRYGMSLAGLDRDTAGQLPRRVWQIRAAELKTVRRKFADLARGGVVTAAAAPPVAPLAPAPAGRSRWASRAPAAAADSSDEELSPSAVAEAARVRAAARENRAQVREKAREAQLAGRR